jgi:hypothetical protein
MNYFICCKSPPYFIVNCVPLPCALICYAFSQASSFSVELFSTLTYSFHACALRSSSASLIASSSSLLCIVTCSIPAYASRSHLPSYISFLVIISIPVPPVPCALICLIITLLILTCSIHARALRSHLRSSACSYALSDACSRFAITSQTLCDSVAIAMQSLCKPCATDLQSLCKSLYNHCHSHRQIVVQPRYIAV